MNIIFDTVKNTFAATGQLEHNGVICFGFVQNGSLPVDLQKITSFGFSINGATTTLPKHGKMFSSSLEVVHQQNINVSPDTDYELTYWAESIENGKVEGLSTLKSTKPAQPFPSWTWDAVSKVWSAPSERSSDSDIWDEPTLSWKPNPMIAEYNLRTTDAYTGARGVEDLIQALIAKGTITEQDLPQDLVDRLAERMAHRQNLS